MGTSGKRCKNRRKIDSLPGFTKRRFSTLVPRKWGKIHQSEPTGRLREQRKNPPFQSFAEIPASVALCAGRAFCTSSTRPRWEEDSGSLPPGPHQVLPPSPIGRRVWGLGSGRRVHIQAPSVSFLTVVFDSEAHGPTLPGSFHSALQTVSATLPNQSTAA